MESKLLIHNESQISYSVQGSGPAVVFLHGYLETKEVFESLLLHFSANYRCVAIDLPGHGSSGCTHESLTMSEMADCVIRVFDELNIKDAAVVGHSMGGYVALEFAASYGPRVSGLCLFHSSPFADTDEKRVAREREKDIARQNRQELIYKNHFPKTFAANRVDEFGERIETLKVNALQMKPVGIIGALNAMQQRKNYVGWLEQFDKPFLYILGESDNFIPLSILDKIMMPASGKSVVLKNTGHMGFWEALDEVVLALGLFFNSCYSAQ